LTMKPAAIDRLMLMWIATALVVWVACLVILWGWAFDTSGVSSVLTLAATMLAVSAAAPLPGRFARAFQRVLIRLGLQDVGAMERTMAAPVISRRSDAIAAVRLLGLAAFFAAACGLVSTLVIFAFRPAADWLAGRVIWPPLAWTIVKVACQAAGMLPIALAVCVVFLLGAIIRGGPGRDPYAAIFGDWLWSLAAGLLIFAAVWLAGANLLGVAVVSGVALLAAGWLLVRRAGGMHMRRRGRPIENRPGVRVRLSVTFAFAILALILAIQARMLTDIAALGIGFCACWSALSIALLAATMREVDRRSRPPARSHGAGAVIGVVAAAMLQSMLGVMCIGRAVAPAACVGLAVAAQAPLAACGAIVISRQRRLFAGVGGRPRAYLSCACVGLGCGLLAYLAIGWAGAPAIWLLCLAMATLAGATVVGIAAARGVSGQVGWAVCGMALAVALAATAALSLKRTGEMTGNVAPGAWLTAVSSGNPQRPEGFLPFAQPPVRRSPRVSDSAGSVFAARGGTWWVVAGAAPDLPAEMPEQVVAVASSPDPSADGPGRPRGWALLRGLWKPGAVVDFFGRPACGAATFDGIFLAPMPADRPEAWRCYNEAAIKRCLSRLNAGGVVALRTQAQADRLRSALAAAATFHSVVGSSWAVMDLSGDQLDIMIVGPAGRTRKPAPREGLYVLSSDELLSRLGRIDPIRIWSPGRFFLRSGPSIESLRERLTAMR